jgi:hypothetical protein
MKFHTVEITGIRRVVFKSYKRDIQKNEIFEKSTIWNRIPTETYEGDEDLDDYFFEFVWVDENRDRVRSDPDMVTLLKDLQYNDRYNLWYNHGTMNVRDLKNYASWLEQHP